LQVKLRNAALLVAFANNNTKVICVNILKTMLLSICKYAYKQKDDKWRFLRCCHAQWGKATTTRRERKVSNFNSWSNGHTARQNRWHIRLRVDIFNFMTSTLHVVLTIV